jgi:exodeoxyribonuclease-3
MIKLASWNVNSLKVRLPQVLDWIESAEIDILGLQEIKCTDADFPLDAFQARGLHVVFSGQKTYNGVAIVSRQPIDELSVTTDTPTLIDPQRRLLATTIGDIRFINLYVPNGASLDSDKYAYKLNWLTHVIEWIKTEQSKYPHLAVVGDFNIAPADEDVHDKDIWQDTVLVSKPERAAFNALLDLGFRDSFRQFEQLPQQFSWWDYRAAGFRRNHGLRIDHILLSQSLSERCQMSAIDKTPRSTERPSDHAPVWVTLEP